MEAGMEAGRESLIEAIISFLSLREPVSDELVAQLRLIADMDKLKALLLKTATLQSMSEFEKEVHLMLSEE